MVIWYFNHFNYFDVSQQPITTGTSVLGFKYRDGIMLAADTLGVCVFSKSYSRA